MDSACQNCGERAARWSSKFPELHLDQCLDCGSLSYRGGEELDASTIYSDEYFHGGEYENYIGHREVHERNFSRRWAILAPHLRRPVRLFEIGCAYGFFIDFARRQGAESVFGTDISQDAIAFARSQFGPHFSVASDASRPPFSFNCLVAWDVWEHLESPRDLLEGLIRDLEPGGVLALTTVDSGAVVARLRGKRWRQIHPPTHLHYPTRRGLSLGLARLGLRIVRHTYLGYYRALESYLSPLGLDRFVRRFPNARTLPIPLDLRDIQLVVATKDEAARTESLPNPNRAPRINPIRS